MCIQLHQLAPVMLLEAVCVHPFAGYAWCVECFWMDVASETSTNRHIVLLQV